MLLPRRILAMAARHAHAEVSSAGCTGPCSRLKTHSGEPPMTEEKRLSRPNSSGFSGPSTLAPKMHEIPATVKKKSRPVREGSRVTQSLMNFFSVFSHASSALASVTRNAVSAVFAFGISSGFNSSSSSSQGRSLGQSLHSHDTPRTLMTSPLHQSSTCTRPFFCFFYIPHHPTPLRVRMDWRKKEKSVVLFFYPRCKSFSSSAYMRACVCMCVYRYMCVCVCMCVYRYMCVYVCVPVHVCVCVCTGTCVCV